MEGDSSRVGCRDGDLIDRLSNLERYVNFGAVWPSDSLLAGGVSGRIDSRCGVRCGIMVILPTKVVVGCSTAASIALSPVMIEVDSKTDY
jgi:hypothetical protein